MGAIPKQIQKQIAEIEEMEKAYKKEPSPESQAEVPVEGDTAQQAQPEAEATPVATEAVAPVESEEKWEQRYKSLQGHFNAEVPKLHQQNKELTKQLENLKAELDQMKVKPQPVEKAEEQRLVTDSDEETYGADLIDLQRRVTREVMREFVNPLKADLAERDKKISALEAMLGKTGGDLATLTFEQRLERGIPDFDKINNDPKWIAWLDEKDAFTGEARRGYAEYVYSQGDVEKLKQIVDYYKQSTGPTEDRSQRQTELNRQVQPPKSASSTQVPPGQRIYSEQEASRLFNKVRDLNIAGKYDEAAKLEQELSTAYLENRVR